jgi:hypothetical protein
MAMISIRMVLFSLRAARSRIAADKKPTEKNNGDDKNGHREKNTQSHDVTPEAKNTTCPATKSLSRCLHANSLPENLAIILDIASRF